MRIENKILLFMGFLAFLSCSKPVVEKPEMLIEEDQMIDMLAAS